MRTTSYKLAAAAVVSVALVAWAMVTGNNVATVVTGVIALVLIVLALRVPLRRVIHQTFILTSLKAFCDIRRTLTGPLRLIRKETPVAWLKNGRMGWTTPSALRCKERERLGRISSDTVLAPFWSPKNCLLVFRHNLSLNAAVFTQNPEDFSMPTIPPDSEEIESYYDCAYTGAMGAGQLQPRH